MIGLRTHFADSQAILGKRRGYSSLIPPSLAFSSTLLQFWPRLLCYFLNYSLSEKGPIVDTYDNTLQEFRVVALKKSELKGQPRASQTGNNT